MSEGFGLYVADENGNTRLDTSVRALKILGSFVIPANRTDYTVKVPIPPVGNAKVFYYAQGNVFDAANSVMSAPLSFFVFDTSIADGYLTINANYAPAITGNRRISYINKVDIRVYYGIY